MKKRSALKRRAVLFTATVMAVTVAVSLCGYAVGTWVQSLYIAHQTLAEQAEYLAQQANQALSDLSDQDKLSVVTERLQDSGTGLVNASGGYVWLIDRNDRGEQSGLCVSADIELPPIRYYLRNAQYGLQIINGKRYVYAQSEIKTPFVYRWVGVSMPMRGMPVGLICAAIAALLGVTIGALVGQGVIDRMLKPVFAPVAKLRDAAVAMANGHLETRADESAPGQFGQLGKALNHLSNQLARNMYTLIVERNRLRNMLNGLSEGIVAIDSSGTVTHTNPALSQLIPKPKLALHLPDPRMKLIPDKTIWEDFDQVLKTGEPVTRNLESKDMILHMVVTPIRDEIDSIAGAVGLFSDITQMERLEKTRRDYVSNVSHELRTPLTAVRALVEPLRDGMVTNEADRQRYYDIILREILRLSRLINDQLELSRLQSGTLSIQKSRMKIDDLVYDVCDRYAAIAEEHGLKLNVNTDFSQCPTVYANEDRLEQMLIILLDNAIKYTEKGSVSVSARWDDEKVVISVNDTGIGIAEADLPYVFDRFYKVDKAHSGKGSGLGLSIAKELLKRMDEDIRVTSEKGKGTQFSFTIHRNPPKEEE